ncbi:hypothetical protein [Marinicella sp. W31]|uniref:hypothetical protein n=1 Tax=Marinicella sp. W31 TaxID=3023713 RepID=UPI003757CD67
MKKSRTPLTWILLVLEILLALAALTLGLIAFFESLYFSKDLLVQNFSLYIALGLLPCGVLLLLAAVMLYRQRMLVSHSAAFLGVMWLVVFILVS